MTDAEVRDLLLRLSGAANRGLGAQAEGRVWDMLVRVLGAADRGEPLPHTLADVDAALRREVRRFEIARDQRVRRDSAR